jgi:2-dehydro-3-deoxygluconokinase
MTQNTIGQYIVEAIARHGVDTSNMIWTAADRVGIYFMEEGRPPRSSRIIYDRRHSAMSRIQPDDLPSELFTPENAKLLHLTGITLALSENAAATAQAALQAAKAAGWRVSFDLNYRANLWSASEALAGCEIFMREADIIFCPIQDAKRLFELSADMNEIAVIQYLHARYSQAVVVLTLGAEGAIAYDSTEHVYRQPAFPAERIDRVGGGDAFNAGFLYGYLMDGDIAIALRWAAAVAALKYTIAGDMPLVNIDEVRLLVEQGGSSGAILR